MENRREYGEGKFWKNSHPSWEYCLPVEQFTPNRDVKRLIRGQWGLAEESKGLLGACPPPFTLPLLPQASEICGQCCISAGHVSTTIVRFPRFSVNMEWQPPREKERENIAEDRWPLASVLVHVTIIFPTRIPEIDNLFPVCGRRACIAYRRKRL